LVATDLATYKDIYSSNGVISNCTFHSDIDFETYDGAAGLYTGSVVSIWSSQVNISDSTFSNLFGNSKGGAVYVCANSTSFIKNTTFENNMAAVGGAVMIEDA
jgi:hypothetical protein